MASNVFVSFSKRRQGLFKKAAELCARCDAKMAVIVLSPRGNPFAFGHSSVDEVLRLYYPDPRRSAAPLAAKHERQKEPLEERLKQEEGAEIMEWIEREWETRKSVEELEFLKQKYLVLLDKVTRRLETS